MRIRGICDGKINISVQEVLSNVKDYYKNDGITNGSSHLFVVPIFKDGHVEIINNIYDEDFEWTDARQVVIFYFNEDGTRCLIRHISDVNQIHKQFIGRKGWRICVNDWIQPMRLCLYHNTSLEEQREVALSNFRNEFIGIYHDYLDYVTPLKKNRNN